ncbi:GMP/IMP nucleotidase [Glaciecola sp. 1036]|uniref:GMP/IMP nucleotidase n=1 Tax=Alteromonadaceae TaxID=72275 RepID=UPI003CFFF041
MALFPWHNIETVLLDMDGTLLDLNFDNKFWLEHLPQKLAEQTNKPLQDCMDEMMQAYSEVKGQLQWYCLDYWEQRLQLDIMDAKQDLKHLIRFRDDAIPFLDALHQSGREVALVTNAHPGTLRLKVEQTALDQHIDTLISTHEFGVSKESQLLWQRLQERLEFDPAHTLFVDDSQVILDAAKEFGIAYTLGITNPDSQLPENEIHGHQHTNNYHDLLDAIIQDNFSAGSTGKNK